jgi:hypothetical protein
MQIENFFHLLRHMPNVKRNKLDAPSTEDQFMIEWNSMHKDDKLPATDEQFLLTFGITHNPQGRTIMISNAGVCPQINDVKYKYDLPQSWMYDKYPGASVNIIYDPFDMSRVLVTNHDDIRFIARTAQLAPRALKDQVPGSRTYLNAILAEKKDQVNRVVKKQIERADKVDKRLFNAEAVLQGGGLIKEIKNEAEVKMMEEQVESGREEWLDNNIDFSIFK